LRSSGNFFLKKLEQAQQFTTGDSPSGKAADFGSAIRGFESLIPSQMKFYQKAFYINIFTVIKFSGKNFRDSSKIYDIIVKNLRKISQIIFV
jgi:hypothetical protein